MWLCDSGLLSLSLASSLHYSCCLNKLHSLPRSHKALGSVICPQALLSLIFPMIHQSAGWLTNSISSPASPGGIYRTRAGVTEKSHCFEDSRSVPKPSELPCCPQPTSQLYRRLDSQFITPWEQIVLPS